MCMFISGMLNLKAETKAIIKNAWIETNISQHDQPGLALHL